MKHFGIIALATIAVLVACAAAQSHNITWGNRTNGDVLLFRNIVAKKSKLMKKVVQDVPYNSTRVITHIKATDQITNGDGGYATLLGGGVGFRNVTIHLKSQRGKGFNFIVEIYGK